MNTNTAAAPAPLFYEEPAVIVFDYTFAATAAGAPQDARSDFSISIDKDSDFLLTSIYGIQQGAYFFNFKTPSGRYFSNVLMDYRNIIGVNAAPTFIGPPLLYRAGSRIAIDFSNNFGGVANPIEIVFSGIRRFNR